MKRKDLEKIDDALFNRAIGFSKEEVSEEYNMIEDKLTLTKKKLNSKYYPPELKAIEILIEKYSLNKDDTYDNYSITELESEKERLLNLLKTAEEKSLKNGKKDKTKN